MSASLLESCVGVVTCPGLCPLAKETVSAALMLCTKIFDVIYSCRDTALMDIRLEYFPSESSGKHTDMVL